MNDTKYDIVGAFFMCIQERREVMAKFQKTKDEEDTMIENYIYSFGRFFLPDEYIYTYLESKDY